MKFISNERGSVAIEAALILPVIIFLALGMIQVSTYLFNLSILSNASGEASRVAALYTGTVRPTVTDINSTVCQATGATTIKTTIGGVAGSSITCTPTSSGNQLIAFSGTKVVNILVATDVYVPPGSTAPSGVTCAAGNECAQSTQVLCPSATYSGGPAYIVVVTLSYVFNGLTGGSKYFDLGVFNSTITSTSKMTCL